MIKLAFIFFLNIFQNCIQSFGHEMLSWVRVRLLGINAHSISPLSPLASWYQFYCLENRDTKGYKKDIRLRIFVYWITSDIPHMFTIKVQVIRNTAHRPSTQASYTIGLGTTMQENQLAAQIAAKHNIFSCMAPYMSWIYLVLVGIDPGVSSPERRDSVSS